jgi:bacteriophage HK97-gp10 putative tail-component
VAGRFEPNRNLRGRVAAEIDSAVEAKADAVLMQARVTAPVDTGAYKNSLRKERTASGWRVVADVPHAIFVEFGTRRQKAYRTLGRALDAARR